MSLPVPPAPGSRGLQTWCTQRAAMRLDSHGEEPGPPFPLGQPVLGLSWLARGGSDGWLARWCTGLQVSWRVRHSIDGDPHGHGEPGGFSAMHPNGFRFSQTGCSGQTSVWVVLRANSGELSVSPGLCVCVCVCVSVRVSVSLAGSGAWHAFRFPDTGSEGLCSSEHGSQAMRRWR